MGMPALTATISAEEWLDELARRAEQIEIVDGVFVVKHVGGNPHHYLARRLAEELERQWPGALAVCPGNWSLQQSSTGIRLGRMPDVLVAGPELLDSSVFIGVPWAVVEVWSPGNTLEEMNTKRREYRQAGLPVLIEAFLTDTGDVHLEWLVNAGDRWTGVAAAIGESVLEVPGPKPFRVLPNALLRAGFSAQ